MSKRPPLDLRALTSEPAVPMTGAAQRTVHRPVPLSEKGDKPRTLEITVAQSLRRRFRQRADEAGLTPEQLLFEALEAWEERRGLTQPSLDFPMRTR